MPEEHKNTVYDLGSAFLQFMCYLLYLQLPTLVYADVRNADKLSCDLLSAKYREFQVVVSVCGLWWVSQVGAASQKISATSKLLVEQ